jgi:uncharacterized membrane protein YbhN (UPF0104 family)
MSMTPGLTRSAPKTPLTQRPWWPPLKRAATLAFFALVAWLLVTQARAVEWGEVMQAVRAYRPQVLLAAAALAVAAHACYCSFDLISRRYAGHSLGTGAVLATTFISYAFNLNLGALVGGLAFRFRLYSRQGLEVETISRVYGFSMLTNWLGYAVVVGGVCLWQPIALPESWPIGSGSLRLLGVVLLALGLGYLALCGLSKRRSWVLRGHTLRLPSLRLALLQMLASCTTWLLIAGVVYMLLQHRADYPTVLAALMAAAVAGVITHVPAGLGVLEAVFITLLTPQIPKSELLAALLVYRAVHYLIPLALATVLFVGFEMRLRRQGR